MKFLDQVKIYIKAGDGGDGSPSFRREKYVEFGEYAAGSSPDTPSCASTSGKYALVTLPRTGKNLRKFSFTLKICKSLLAKYAAVIALRKLKKLRSIMLFLLKNSSKFIIPCAPLIKSADVHSGATAQVYPLPRPK